MTCASLPVPWAFSSLAVACTAQSTLTHSRRFSIHEAQHPDGPDDLVPDRLPSVTILIWLVDRVHSTPSPSSSSSSAAAFLETSHFPTTKPPLPSPRTSPIEAEHLGRRIEPAVKAKKET
ncbi:unnamed protein product, partial [Musa banksii]